MPYADKDLGNVSAVDFGGKPFSADQIAAVAAVSPTARGDAERWATRRAVAGQDFGLVADGVTDDAPAINAIMAALAERGGGVVEMPPANIGILSPIDNQYARVLVQGAGREGLHDAGSRITGTRVLPLPGFVGSALLKHRTPYSSTAAKNTGGGFRYIETFGGPRGLEVDTVAYAEYDLAIIAATGTEGALFKPGRSGIDIAEAADIQGCKIHLNVRQIDAGVDTAHCVVFAASTNANVSLNTDVDIRAQHTHGHALWCRSADNNIISILGVRPVGGTGRTVQMGDASAYDPNLGGNIFMRISGVGGAHLLGTDTPGAVANSAQVISLDTGNGTPLPTAGTGSSWQVYGTTDGVMMRQAMAGLALGNDYASTKAARGSVGSETLRVSNYSSNHIQLEDQNANASSISIEGLTGSLRLYANGGASPIDLNGGGDVQIFGQTITVGAVNSGGSGFRYLRVPN